MPGDIVNDMILRVHLSNKPDNVTEIPINPETTCEDVVDMCKEPGEEHCHLAENFMGTERPVGGSEVITDLLQQLGPKRKDVKFIFRHNSPPSGELQQNGPVGRPSLNSKAGNMSESNMMADDVDLSLSELQDMVSWQQQQIGNQQQLLVAKQQRLKFLKQQEMKHQQEQEENERLQKLKDKVEFEEQKLKRLRAVQGQVESTRLSNDSLSAELESVKALFAEKEKELAQCFAKVEEMTQQLKELKNGTPNGTQQKHDIERLKQELLNHNSRNEQQSAQLEKQASLLNQRTKGLREVDKRIEELKELFHRRKSSQNMPPLHTGNKNSNNSRNLSNGSVPRGKLYASSQRSVPPNGNHPSSNGQNGDRRSLPLSNGGPPPDTSVNSAWRKPVIMSGNRPGETNLSSQQKPTPNPRNSPQPNRNPVPQPRRPPQDTRNRDDNSGSDTSSLTENSSLDSVPSFTGSSRQKPIPPARPARMSPVQNVRNNGSYLGERSQSPVLRGPVASINQNRLSVLSEKDPHTKHLVSKPRNRSPIYSPSSPTSGTPWPPTDIDMDTGSQVDGLPREPNRNIPVPAARHPPSPPMQHPIPQQRSNTSNQSHDAVDSQSSRASPSSSENSSQQGEGIQNRSAQPIFHRRSPATVGIYNSGNGHPLNDPHGYDSELSDISQQDDTSMAAISADRPASPIRDPTLVLHHHYKDADRLQNMPRPLKKRISFTESKDENFSFMKSEYREKFFQHTANAKGNLSLKEVPEKTSSEASDGVQKEDQKAADEYRNDAILTHKQYKEALAMLAQSPILSQSTTRVAPRGILKREGKSRRRGVRVRFDPLALLLDAALEGEYDQVRRIIQEVPNPSDANDEGITALHNAICANHSKIVNFLILFGVDVNSPDSDGWTPLHCAASCNNLKMVRALVERGGCVFATTISDKETPAQKCEKEEDGYLGCFEYLNDIQEKMGVVNNGAIFGVYHYEAEKEDELGFKDGEELKVIRKGDEEEELWWWASNKDGKEGYIPRNLVAMYPRVKPLFN